MIIIPNFPDAPVRPVFDRWEHQPPETWSPEQIAEWQVAMHNYFLATIAFTEALPKFMQAMNAVATLLEERYNDISQP